MTFAQRIAKSTDGFARKEIYADSTGSKNATAFILVGYDDSTLANFQAMAHEAGKTFGIIDPNNIRCGVITKSNIVKGFLFVSFQVPNQPARGWEHYDYPERFS